MQDLNKTALNVGTIGHVDHGKTTLTAAISLCCSMLWGGKARAIDEIDNHPEEKARGITINAAHVAYETPQYRVSHVDCPGHADYIKNMISGAAQMDGAILLVDGTQGPQEQTREHILLAHQVRAKIRILFINKCDAQADKDLIDLVEMEALDLLSEYGFNDVTVIKGSAREALAEMTAANDVTGTWTKEIIKLLVTIDQLPSPDRDYDAPFAVFVEDVFSIKGIGTVATGRIERGTIKKGDPVEIVGMGAKEGWTSTVTGIEAYHQKMDEAKAGDNVGLLLRGVAREDLARGMVLCKPGSFQPHTKFECRFDTLSKEAGGRVNPFETGYRPQCYFTTADVTGTIQVLDGKDKVIPGETGVNLQFHLERPVAMMVGQRFAVREGGKTIGGGEITKILE